MSDGQFFALWIAMTGWIAGFGFAIFVTNTWLPILEMSAAQFLLYIVAIPIVIWLGPPIVYHKMNPPSGGENA